MGSTYMDFGTGTFHVDGDGPLTQDQVDSVWRKLPTTGAGWIERGRLLVQQWDGAKVFDLGLVERGVKGVSDAARMKGYGVRGGGGAEGGGGSKKSPAQLQREIDDALWADDLASRRNPRR